MQQLDDEVTSAPEPSYTPEPTLTPEPMYTPQPTYSQLDVTSTTTDFEPASSTPPRRTPASGGRRSRHSRKGLRRRRRPGRTDRRDRRDRRRVPKGTVPVAPVVEASVVSTEESDDELNISQKHHQGKSDHRSRVISSDGDEVEKSPVNEPPMDAPRDEPEEEPVEPVVTPTDEPNIAQTSPTASPKITSPEEQGRGFGQPDVYHPWQDSTPISRPEIRPQTPHTPGHSYQQHVSPQYHRSPPTNPQEPAPELPGWVDPPSQSQAQFLPQPSEQQAPYPGRGGFEQQFGPQLHQTSEPQPHPTFSNAYMPSVMNSRTASPFREGYPQMNPAFGQPSLVPPYPPHYGGSSYRITPQLQRNFDHSLFPPHVQHPLFSSGMHQPGDGRGDIPNWPQQHQIHQSTAPPHLHRPQQQPSPPHLHHPPQQPSPPTHRANPSSGTGRGYSINSILENNTSSSTGSPVPQQQQQQQHLHPSVPGYPRFMHRPQMMTQEQANYTHIIRYQAYMEQLARMHSSANPRMYPMGNVPPFISSHNYLGQAPQQSGPPQDSSREEPQQQQDSGNQSA